MNRIAHLRIIVCVCILAVAGYGYFSWWVVHTTGNEALKGDVIGTWKSFAVGVFSFWIGSSSGGKSKSDTPTEGGPS